MKMELKVFVEITTAMGRVQNLTNLSLSKIFYIFQYTKTQSENLITQFFLDFIFYYETLRYTSTPGTKTSPLQSSLSQKSNPTTLHSIRKPYPESWLIECNLCKKFDIENSFRRIWYNNNIN